MTASAGRHSGQNSEVKPVRRTWRGDERSDRLRRAAAALFLERGYAGVSVDEIVQVAGGSKTNVYSFFGGKSGLFLAVVELLCNELLEPLATIDVTQSGVVAGLRTIARALLDVILEERALALHRIVAAEALACPDAARLWFESAPARVHGVLADFITRHQKNGTLRPGNPREVAVLFHDMLTLNMHVQRLFGLHAPFSHAEVDAHIESVIALFVHGFKAPVRRGQPALDGNPSE
jgi:TetR/AcrR family transcriptional regulator, mexJK operon transcriptional repressor